MNGRVENCGDFDTLFTKKSFGSAFASNVYGNRLPPPRAQVTSPRIPPSLYPQPEKHCIRTPRVALQTQPLGAAHQRR